MSSIYAGVISQTKMSDWTIFVKIVFGISGAPVVPLESSRSSISIFNSLNAEIILVLPTFGVIVC